MTCVTCLTCVDMFYTRGVHTLAAEQPADTCPHARVKITVVAYSPVPLPIHGAPFHSWQATAIVALCSACHRQISHQPTLVRARAPAKIFGDVHGQLRDLLLLFGWYGAPTHQGGDVQTTSYVFNGDWVDRGAHQLEVVQLHDGYTTLT